MSRILLKIFFLSLTFNQIIFGQVNISEEKINKGNISLQKVLDIGVWSGDEQKTFYKIKDVKTDKNSNIYILDSGNHRIQKFDVAGEYICSIGHKGQGPGEFENPISMFINNKGNIYVLDKGLLRVTQFDQKGTYINSIHISSQNSFDFVVDNLGNLTVLEASGKNILNKYNDKGKILKSFCNIKALGLLPEKKKFAKTDLEKRFYNDFQNITYSKGAIAINQNIIYLTFKFPYKILTFNTDGKLLREYTKIVTYPITPPDNLAEEKESQSTFRVVTVKISFGTAFGIDICVKRNMIFNLVASRKNPNGNESKEIDVFNLNGKFLSQIKLPHFTKKIYVDENFNLFCVVEGVDQFTLVSDEIPPKVVKYSISIIEQ